MLILPTAKERFRTASDLFQDEAAKLWEDDIDLNDTRYGEIAIRAISALVPEMLYLGTVKKRATVDSSLAVAVCTDPVVPFITFEGAHVEGALHRISIEEVIVEEQPGEPITGIDLCLNIRPQYRDPDPVDIIFGDELCVPFSQVDDVQPER